MRAWACLCLLVLLTACASEPVIVTKRVPVLPPSAYLEPCSISLGDGTVQGALLGLRATLECDRADKAALRAWADRAAPSEENGSSPGG